MTAHQKKSYFPIALCTLLIVACAILYFFFDPTQHSWMPQCPFRILTGWNCPACGLQRALHALLHGHLSEALSHNYFLVILLPYALVLLATEIIQRTDGLHGEPFIRAVKHPLMTWGMIILALLWGLIRNLLQV